MIGTSALQWSIRSWSAKAAEEKVSISHRIKLVMVRRWVVRRWGEKGKVFSPEVTVKVELIRSL